jgi:hypothetical protein
MEPCTVETGLLRKTPCGSTAVAKCANCERPLCSKHAIAQLSAAGKKTGTFMCAECDKALRDYDKTAARTPKPVAAKPPAQKPPAAPPAKPAEEHGDGSIDFTPTKK